MGYTIKLVRELNIPVIIQYQYRWWWLRECVFDCCPHACHACCCAHPCSCFCFCVAICCCWWICRRCWGAPIDIWGGSQLRTVCLSIRMLVTPLAEVTPSTQSNLFPTFICFFYLETHKVSTSIRGGFHILLHKTFLEQVHSARLSCTADTRPLNEFEKVRIWPKIE